MHRDLEKGKGTKMVSSPRKLSSPIKLRRYRNDRDTVYYDDQELNVNYMVIHVYPPNNGDLFTNGQTTLNYTDGKYVINEKASWGNYPHDTAPPYKLSKSLYGYGYIIPYNIDYIYDLIDIKRSFEIDNIYFYPNPQPYAPLTDTVSAVNNFSSGNGHSFMFPGNTLKPDEHLISPNGQYKCHYQNDGNLVVSGPGYLKGILPCGKYNPNKYTEGGGAPPGTLVYDDSGQLIIYTNFESGHGTAVWATGIQGGANPYLILQDDGILGSYSNGKKIWSTAGHCP